jgi:hypothetical protein
MIKLLTSQAESDRLFDRWAKQLIASSSEFDRGWVIEGSGIAFSNYGDGARGTIRDSVMLGLDTALGQGVVKIVRPLVAKQDRGKLTAIGRDDDGRKLLLRQGWLKKNPLSRALRKDFAELTGLQPVMTTPGLRSPRDWYLVANLSADRQTFVRQTVDFVNACARGRSKAGGAAARRKAPEDYRIGLDEKGRTRKVTVTGGTREVVEMQGHVWEALKKRLGSRMSKRARNRYAVDVLIETAGLLIEIKTGVSAHDVYEAVGQLSLYPSLIKLPDDLERILLVPDQPQLRPSMAAAIATAGVDVYFYSIGNLGKKPKIRFSNDFLARCGNTPEWIECGGSL